MSDASPHADADLVVAGAELVVTMAGALPQVLKGVCTKCSSSLDQMPLKSRRR
jgi:hypothetical protein